MRVNRKVITIAAVAAALTAGGAGIAYAVGGGSEEEVTGAGAERAKAAALDAVPGGEVLEVERQDGDGAGAFEVEVKRPDGSQVEVDVSGGFHPLGTSSDDGGGETPGEDDGEGAED